MIRVVVVDDQRLMRSGLVALLERAADIAVAGQAGDGAAGVALVLAERPDVVLMDIRMPGVDGIEATRRIVADGRLRSTRVVMLTTFDTDEHIFDAIRVGAAGFLLKDTDRDELRAAVRTVPVGDPPGDGRARLPASWAGPRPPGAVDGAGTRVARGSRRWTVERRDRRADVSQPPRPLVPM